mgnify:CR=1 FL=1
MATSEEEWLFRAEWRPAHSANSSSGVLALLEISSEPMPVASRKAAKYLTFRFTRSASEAVHLDLALVVAGLAALFAVAVAAPFPDLVNPVA